MLSDSVPIHSAQAGAHAAQPDWLPLFQNLGREHAFEPLRVEGRLPADLQGTLYRNGPGLQKRFEALYSHIFDGDGAVACVRFARGRALGACRVMRTPALLREERAGRRLFGGYNTPLVRPLRETLFGDRKNPANTSVMEQAGRLYALCEAGLPLELDASDLRTLGECDFEGAVLQAFNAHPHAVPSRRAKYCFGLRPGRVTKLDLYELPDAGAVRRMTTIPLPGVAMLHDFCVSERHAIFVLPPLRVDLLSMLRHRTGLVDSLRFRKELGTEIVIVPLDEPNAVRRATVPSFYVEHFANAFERAGRLSFDFTCYPSFATMQRFLSKLSLGRVDGSLGSTLQRGHFELDTGRVELETLLDRPIELPQVSPRVWARPHRYVYLAGHASEAAASATPWDSVLKLDTQTGAVCAHTPGAGHYVSEPSFIARADARHEDDGYLLSFVFDATRGHSYVAVLDARAPDADPIARAYFTQTIPFRVHGTWLALPA